MANADEAAIQHESSSALGVGAADLDDETQDFRILSSLSSGGQHGSIPKRGEKDFEPHGGLSQSQALHSAQEAMRAALSQPRVHGPKAHVIGILDPVTGKTRVLGPKGQHFRTTGRADSKGTLYLMPEESLYLLERGTLDVRWAIGAQDTAGTKGEDGNERESTTNEAPESHVESGTEERSETGRETRDRLQEVPLSLQSAYALLIGAQGLTLEQYTVYASLKRSGYIVFRASEEDGEALGSDSATIQHPWTDNKNWITMKLLSRLWPGREDTGNGPLVKPGLYRNYNTIFRQIALVPFHKTTKTNTSTRNPDLEAGFSSKEAYVSPLRVTFWVWKPRPSYKKSAPGRPDFRIAVLDARESEFLNLSDFDALLNQTPYAPPPHSTATHLYQRLKHGWRSVIIAIVDCGVVSYVRVGDAQFGNEKLYEGFGKRGPGRKGGRGPKKGG